jgi:hypothetical protein
MTNEWCPMKDRNNGFGREWIGICAGAFFLSVASAWAGVSMPFYVGNVAPVLDEYGRPMRGSHRTAEAASRPRVEIRTSTDGIIRPPSTNGSPHPYNPLLTPTSVGGMGMNTASADSGLFCLVLTNRPAPGTKLFARAFNAPTWAESSFYADTTMATVPTAMNGTSLKMVFGAAKPLDSGDADADGLNNSWEKTLGTDDRAAADYDGDGMLDLHEMLAGTLPTDPGSLLEFRSIRREDVAGKEDDGEGEEDSRPIRMRWQSVPGRRYQVQYLPSLLGEQVMIPVGEVVTADDDECEKEMLVDLPDDAVAGNFRVRLVRD